MNRSPRLVDGPALPGRSRGVALIEALVALLIMAFGMVALTGLQSNLRRSADVAKQRGEAIRMAQQEMERLRNYSVLANAAAGEQAFADIATTAVNPNAGDPNSNASFAMTRTVTNWPGPVAAITAWQEPQQKAVNVSVVWQDRAGADQFVVIDSLLTGIDPSLSGSLRWAPDSSPLRRPAGREASIPIEAKDLGQGKSVFVPGPNATVAWVFNNVTGVVVGRCTVAMGTQSSALTEADVAACSNNTIGYLLSGFVRFSFGSSPDPIAPASAALPQLGFEIVRASPQPQPPLPSGVSATQVPAPPSYECFNDSPPNNQVSLPYVSYYCLVFPSNDIKPRWSGKLNMTGVGSAYKVCRYSADYNGDGKILNVEHPLNYCSATKSLTKQNFLVVSATESCPAGHAVDPPRGFFSNSMTVAHEVENRTVPYPAAYDAALVEDVCAGPN